jgi:hypothetical protein
MDPKAVTPAEFEAAVDELHAKYCAGEAHVCIFVLLDHQMLWLQRWWVLFNACKTSASVHAGAQQYSALVPCPDVVI